MTSLRSLHFDTATLAIARQHAEVGQFDDFLALCRQISDSLADDPNLQLDIGALLSSYGFLNDARACYEKAQTLAPTDLRAQVNLANLARDAGEHAEARRLYTDLLRQLPDHPAIRRNALTSLEYDPEVPDAERLVQAQAWGAWAIARTGGVRPRPALQPLQGRPLRIGYVSADLCQHTVGLFVKDVLKTHDPTRVQVFAYSAGQVNDWVADEIRSACTFRDVASLDDAALADQIRADGIDVLIDLSGHTAGSRLTAFAHRPAPVMVSWLGYFATTGLPTMDAVLLDAWHAPSGTEAQFAEPILRLPSGRFCYQPVPWAPAEVSASAFERNGFITFGCFNNTAKFNAGVFDAWARVLHAVPDARLILKWRTFNDEAFRQQVTDTFTSRGIAAERIELRGPSFHADLLKEYADLDIALDPFPFTGGLTSCEALWMGVPVVTWPQTRVVSRQTHAFLHQIGLPELSAKDTDDYVRIAAELANDRERLTQLRTTLRDRMRASPLMDVAGFTRQLEGTLIDLYRRIEAEESHKAMNARILQRTILHVGPGHRNNGAKLPVAFQSSEWQEIRLDIDPANEPDIVGSMLDMAVVADASVDAIYSAHNIEHVYAHEVPLVLKEFLRVLKPDGFLVVTCPDLQTVCQLVAEDKLGDAAYTSQAGPITPLDILYGHGAALAAGHLYMAHKTGFTLKTLTQALHAAGFASSAGKRRLKGLDLWFVASKGPMEEEALRELAGKVLPG
ncbi:methyltransferase domain-containing protein [Allochromatium humboldtianum]|uniref:O-linked N-acetylglucosamine transferase family protein n=1 Tax=Allochromatium humboldtianum TaxID=504901 RepID=UPI001CA3B2E6